MSINYQKKYIQKKEQIINELRNAFNSSIDLLDISFSIESISFQNGRNEDDFIEIILLNNQKELYCKITFWITFWLNFQFDNSSFTILYYLCKDKTSSGFHLNFSIEYASLKGNNLEDKTRSLLIEISKN